MSQVPGEIEGVLQAIPLKALLKKFLSSRNPGPIMFPKGKPLGGSSAADAPPPIILPSWLSEEDIEYYASKFEKTGFTGGINYYRALPL